jgi:hypothetical protein
MSYYNPLVKPELRSRWITLTEADARSTVALKDLGGNLIIRAGGSDGIGFTDYQDKAWDNRQSTAEVDGIPTTMWFALDPAWYRANNVDEGMITDRSGDPSRQPVLLRFLRCLFKSSLASWDTMKAAPPSMWRNVQAYMFSQYNTMYKGADIGDFWFTLSIRDIIDQVKVLMAKGIIPTRPIILQSSMDLFQKYQDNLAPWLAYKPATTNDATARSSWLYLAYGGPVTWTLYGKQYSFYNTIAECWPFTWINLPASYSWGYVPPDYEKRIIFHEVSGDRLYTPAFTDTPIPPATVGKARPLILTLANDTDAVIQALLAGTLIQPPPGDLAALTARVNTLADSVTNLTTRLTNTLQAVNDLVDVVTAHSTNIDAIKDAINKFKVS